MICKYLSLFNMRPYFYQLRKKKTFEHNKRVSLINLLANLDEAEIKGILIKPS